MIELFKNWYRRHFSVPGAPEFACVLISIFIIIYFFMWLVGPLVVALCLAYCLDGAVCFFMRHLHVGRRLSASIVMCLFIGAALLALILVVPQIINQGISFYNIILSMGADVSQAISAEAAHSDEFVMSVKDIDLLITQHIMNFVSTLPDPIPSMVAENTVLSALTSIRSQLMKATAVLMRTQLVPSVFNAFSWLIYLIIVPIFTFLMLANKYALQKRVLTYILPNRQNIIKEFWPSINSQIAGYIRGKIVHIIVIAIANTLAFKIMGLNYGTLLGAGVGLSVVVPYVGAVLIGVPVILVALLQFGFSMTLAWVLGVYVIIQLLDSNVLTPMLFSKALNLDAFSILAAILIFGGLWGFWGVFFAIPLATLIKTIISRWPSADADPQRLLLKAKD